MKRSIILQILAMTLMMAAICFASSELVGTSGGSFLKILGNARPFAMSGAYIAVADDAGGQLYNPAGILSASNAMFSTMYNSHIAGISNSNLSILVPLKNIGFALSYDRVSYGSIQETTLDDPGGTGSTFDPANYALTASFAGRINSRLSLGGNIKYIEDQINGSNASDIGLDAGFMFNAHKNIKFGGTIKNLGNFGNYRLPANLGIGVAVKYPKVLAAFDVNFPNDNGAYANIGLEYTVFKGLYLRTGYSSMQGKQSISAGLGIIMKSARIDYSYNPVNDLGAAHRVSLSFDLFPGSAAGKLKKDKPKTKTSVKPKNQGKIAPVKNI